MKAGDRVRMTREMKARWIAHNPDNAEHIAEFEGCVGVVEGDVYGDGEIWDVRWAPSGLRYAYLASDLEVLRSG